MNRPAFLLLGFLCLGILGVAWAFHKRLSEERRFERVTLHSITSDKGSSCFKLQASYKITFHGITNGSWRIDDIQLAVVRHDLGYQNLERLFHFESTALESGPCSTVEPTYEGKYLPSGASLLPSGRLFWADNSLNLAFFDGKSCRLFLLNPAASRFVANDNPSKHTRAGLAQLFKTSFAPDDVYWSYCLVRHADFFVPVLAPQASVGGFVDTKALFEQWNILKKQVGG